MLALLVSKINAAVSKQVMKMHKLNFALKKLCAHRLEHRALLLTVILASLGFPLISELAPSNAQEKRGIELSKNPTETSQVAPLRSNVKPELVIQAGHTKPINAVVFSPDGRWIASGGKDDTIKIWDLATGYVLRTLYAHSSNVNALAVSPDGKFLASASGDMTDKRDLSTFKRGGIVGGMADNTVRVWDVLTGREIRVLRGHELPVGGVAFSTDGRSLTTASGDSVKVWDLSTGNELRSQKTKYDKSGMEKYDSIRSFSIFGRDKRETQQAEWQKNLKLSASRIVVSGKGDLAAVGQPDKPIRIYHANTGRELRELTFKALPEAEHSSIAFSSDARLVAYAKTNGLVSVEEAGTGRELYNLNTGVSQSPQRIAFSNNLLLTVTDPGGTSEPPTMKLWDTTTGQFVRTLSTNEQNDNCVFGFSSDGRLLAIVGASSKTIRIIDVGTGRELRALPTGASEDNSRPKQAFLDAIDPKTLADLKERGITSREEIVDAIESLGTIANEKFPVGHALTMSPDGRYLISRHMFLKNEVTEIWDVTTGTPVKVAENSPIQERGKPHFSPDGRYRVTPNFPMKGIYTTSARDYNIFASSDDWDKIYDQKVQIQDSRSGRKLREINAGKAPDVGIVPVVGFNFDGSQMALTGYEDKRRVVLIYETETGRKVKTFGVNDENDPVATLAISADARLLTVAHTTRIDMFEIASGKMIRTLPHSGKITSLTFSPEGRFVVALGENNDKYIWDADTGEKLATLVNLSGAFTNRDNDWLVVTPDGLFDGSPEGWNQILWQFGGNTFDFTAAETFFNEFYYPGLLADIMSGSRPRAPKTLAQMDRRQPEVNLLTQQQRGEISERNLNVTISVTEKPAGNSYATGSGARDVRLFRNGSLVKVWRGDVLKGQSSTTLEVNIPVVAGENRLTAYAFNRDNVKSQNATLNVKGAESLRRSGIAYVVAIGINVYENPQYNLRYAVADAQSFADEVRLQQQKLSRYERIEIITLKDHEATKENILTVFKRLTGSTEELPHNAPAALRQLKPAQPEDTVLIFYAGHGTAQGQRFYLIPHDLGYQGERSSLDAGGLQTILKRSISDEELEQVLEGVDASQLLMVIDACNSGQALEAEEKRRGPMNSKGLAQLAYEKGMYILTAAQGYQAALESSQLGHGYLTYALVEEGLKTTAADAMPKDNLVIVREWFDFAAERVPQMQEAKMASRGLKLQGTSPAPENTEKKITVDARISDVQRPRVFYRRELEPQPFIVAKQ